MALPVSVIQILCSLFAVSAIDLQLLALAEC